MPMWLVLVGGIALGGIGFWLIFKKNSHPGIGLMVLLLGAFFVTVFFMNNYLGPEKSLKPNQETNQIQGRNE